MNYLQNGVTIYKISEILPIMNARNEKRVYEVELLHVNGEMAMVVEEGDGYRKRGTRIDIGSFSIVTIEQEHPNYGYFSDYMVWITSLHLLTWESLPMMTGALTISSLEKFLENVPQFTPLFAERNDGAYLLQQV